MINIGSVSNAVFTIIASDQFVVGSNYYVDLNEPFNTDSNRQPWVGIFTGETNITPGQMNIRAPWESEYLINVFIQDSSLVSGQKATDNALRAIEPVFTAVNSDRTLKGTVIHITEMNILPFQRNDDDNEWMFAYLLEITAMTTPI